jgi:hypothetical protein
MIVIGQVLYTDRRREGCASHVSCVRPGGPHITAKRVHASTSLRKLSLSLLKDSPRRYLILLLSITLPSPLPWPLHLQWSWKLIGFRRSFSTWVLADHSCTIIPNHDELTSKIALVDIAAVISMSDDVRSGELRNKLFLLEKRLPCYMRRIVKFAWIRRLNNSHMPLYPIWGLEGVGVVRNSIELSSYPNSADIPSQLNNIWTACEAVIVSPTRPLGRGRRWLSGAT